MTIMNFDFPTILVSATFVTGIIWASDTLFFVKQRKQEIAAGKRPDREPVVVETSRSFFPVILIVLLLRSFLVEPFRIPSGSMMPTLLIGDFILVNKFIYGIRLPVIDLKVLNISEPQRGDVVVFRYPEDPSIDYIKRVVGLPGDKIGYHTVEGKKILTINGKQINQIPLGIYQGKGAGIMMSGSSHFQEQLDTIEHDILVAPGHPSLEGDYIVPLNNYFVMGDNRDNSKDSRYWGMLPEQNLVGKAFFIWMNWDWANGGVGFTRIGRIIN